MKENLVKVLIIDLDLIGIKVIINECLGFMGREEGIVVYSVVLLIKEG